MGMPNARDVVVAVKQSRAVGIDNPASGGTIDDNWQGDGQVT
jgi:hypothetical protein